MKKKTKRATKKRGADVDPAIQAGQSKALGRRRFLRLARNGAIALPVLAGVGIFSARSVQATICEADLTKIGRGKPSIVQIHDPGCPLCRTLQKQSRRALKSFEDDSFTFLVANINTADGAAIASKYNVPHVTLLLFDTDGEMVQIVRGPSDADSLREIFASHLNVSS